MKKLDEILAAGVSAILPDYQPNIGNVTKILNMDGVEYVEKKKVQAVLRRLASVFSVDLAAMRKRYSTMLHQRNIIPIPICEHILLVPFKIRKPIIENDGSLGYINYSSIKAIHKTNNSQLVDIILNNGCGIRCMASYKTACKHMKNAEMVRNHYCSLHIKTPSLQSINDVYLEYDKPATKTDIALLNMQVAELKQCIKEHFQYLKKSSD